MTRALRLLFVLLAILGLAERILWYRAGAANRAPLTTLGLHVTAIGLHSYGVDRYGLIEASAPGCPIIFPIGMFALDGSENARFAPLITPADRPLFIYLGAVASHPGRRHAVLAWLTANARTMLFLRPTQAPNKQVLALLPATCPALTRLDWPALSQ